jgi:hypothetical protein
MKTINTGEGQGLATFLGCSHHPELLHRLNLDLCGEDKMIIYQIENKITGQVYIGQYSKCNSNGEFQNSKYWGSGKYLKRAIQKYGLENFEKKVLLKNINTLSGLDYYETLWIKKKKSKIPNGYNLTDGGEHGNLGYRFTQKQLETLSKSHIGQKPIFTGKTYEEFYGETKAKRIKSQVSIRKKGKTLEELYGIEKATRLKENFKQKTSGANNYFYGKKLTEEHKNKIKENHWSKKENAGEIKKRLAKYREGKTFEDIFGEEKAKKIKEKSSKILKGKSEKEYVFTNPKGEEIKARGFYKFCRENNLGHCQMWRLLAGKTKIDNYKGWKIRYA